MAKEKDDAPFNAPGSRGINDLRVGLENLMLGQFKNWNRIWERLEGDDYSFGKWTSDVVRYWAGWLTGAANLALSPLQRAGDAVQTVVFLLDSEASAKVKKEVVLPPNFNVATAQLNYELVPGPGLPEEIAKKLALKFDPKEDEGRLKISLNPTVAELRDSWRSGTEARAIVFQDRKPIVAVMIIFK